MLKNNLVTKWENLSSNQLSSVGLQDLSSGTAGVLRQSDLRQIVSEGAMHSCAFEAIRAMLYASVGCVLDVKGDLLEKPLKDSCIRRLSVDVIAHKLRECHDQFLPDTDFESLAHFYCGDNC